MKIYRPMEGASLARFRTRLLVGMVLVVVTITALGFFLAQRKVMSEASLNMQDDFQNQLADLDRVQELRNSALTELCRNLVMRPRIHAALEDDALDVLYLSARDEMQEFMRGEGEPAAGSRSSPLQAKFYRFLDNKGQVISPPAEANAGPLSPFAESQLSLPRLPEKQQVGYIVENENNGPSTIDEVIAIPIVSSDTGEVISTLILGFEPSSPNATRDAGMTRNGIFVRNHLELPGLSSDAIASLTGDLNDVVASRMQAGNSLPVTISGEPHLLFYKQINSGSLFVPAYEVVIYPLAPALRQEHRLWWQFTLSGVLLLLAGLVASYFLAARLSTPVEKLEVDSREDRAKRQKTEAELAMASSELRRAVRFSADASHQLKTPLTVLRAGLEDLLTQNDLQPGQQEEVEALVHQTFRLTSIIEDLLLLSRMEAGRLQINFTSVNVTEVVDGLVDDLTALPDGPKVRIDQDGPPLNIAGEKRYVAIILQNLIENAWKYNFTGGEIRVICREQDEWAIIAVANTGKPIPLEAREHIFERFHRATMGEDIPGHGLGLNLARELARLHGGDLNLTRSDEKWTEFAVRFRLYVTKPEQPSRPVAQAGCAH